MSAAGPHLTWPQALMAAALALTILGASRPAASHVLLARQTPAVFQSKAASGMPPGWPSFTYAGAVIRGGARRPARRIPSYSLAYPPGWSARAWPDTLAAYGQLDLYSPAGTTFDLVLIPLQPRGPALPDVIAHDAAGLAGLRRGRIALSLGQAVLLSGADLPTSSGRTGQFLYLRRGGLIYRLAVTRAVGPVENHMLIRIAATLRVPAVSSPPPPAPTPVPPPPLEVCCHCPAWGAGWGKPLAQLDGVAVYWNAGDIDNGCQVRYGFAYQCVELVQRYFALRWGYPAIWGGVEGAADMRANHPPGVQFIPNGGAPGPREGDALLFYGGVFGHVALVQSVDRRQGRLTVVEENWSPTGQADLSLYGDGTVGIRDSAYGSYTVAGWLHSPRNTAMAAPPPPGRS